MPIECDSSEDAITIAFPTTGIEVAPHESDLRLDRRKYAYGDFTLTEEAGELIANNVPDYSKAYIYISDTLAHRMIYFSDNIEFERNLDDDTVVNLELADATKVLQNGTITENFEQVELEEVVDYIMDQYGDPDNVINDYEFDSSVNIEEYRTSLRADSIEGVPILERVGDAEARIMRGAGTKIDNIFNSNLSAEVHDGFDWQKVTPLAALSEVLNEYELDWWVTKTGILRIGVEAVSGKILTPTGSSDSLVINHYGVTTSPDRVRGVHLEGSYRTLKPAGEGITTYGSQFDRLVGIAESVDTSSSGTVVAGDVQKAFSSLDELEQITERQLYREMLNQTSGSIGINGLASKDKETLAFIDVGDVIVLDDSFNVACDRDLITGPYLIFGIQHKRNRREGWTINVELTRIPDFDKVETTSVWYDPQEDKEYESLEEYRRDYDPGFNFEPTFGVDTDILLDNE